MKSGMRPYGCDISWSRYENSCNLKKYPINPDVSNFCEGLHRKKTKGFNGHYRRCSAREELPTHMEDGLVFAGPRLPWWVWQAIGVWL